MERSLVAVTNISVESKPMNTDAIVPGTIFTATSVGHSSGGLFLKTCQGVFRLMDSTHYGVGSMVTSYENSMPIKDFKQVDLEIQTKPHVDASGK